VPDDPPLLRVTRLTKHFRGVHAVNNVSFDVGKGEIVGLIGPNGAGKTTTFNLISGLFPATSGQVELAGVTLTGLRPDRVAATGLRRTFQGTRVFPRLSVEENLRIPNLVPRRTPISREHADRRTAEILELTGLAAFRGVEAGSMPYARQSLLGIGLALAGDPTILLLDEPFAGMNPGETMVAARLVRQIRATGITVLLVEHDMPAVMTTCDRIIVLDQGRKLAEGSPDEVRRNPEVVEAYLGTELDA
jgi:branched-chain amino acid transport system ATP-binding protein